VSLLVYYALGHFQMNAAKFWLAALSFFFYGWWNPNFLLLLVGSILFNYCCGYLILIFQDKTKISSFILASGILANLGVLFYFKYLFNLLDWFHEHGFYQGYSTGSVILPLGISFFTFTQIGFLIDIQGGNVRERGFLEYVLFVTFFPHLIAGPILHHREIMPQFAKKETYSLNWDNIGIGISIFVIGLAKKVLIADQLAPIANDIFKHTADKHIVEAWAGVLAYSLQLYFDFAGYSEMALGLARMFNVKFPANFDSPYKSKSIIDFWQRWHISLTRYFTLYLYNPVSLWIMRRRAPRPKGLALLRAEEATWEGFLVMLALPTLYTMILMGIWHGAGIQFFIFGLLHGFYLCVNHAWRLFGPKVSKLSVSRWRSWWDGAWKWGLTYLSVLVALVFFRAKTATDAWLLIQSMIGRGTGDSPGGAQGVVESILDYFGVAVPYWNYTNCFITLGICFIFILVFPNVLQIFEKEGASLTNIRSAPAFFPFRWNPDILWGLMLAVLALATLLMVTGNSEFLYFRF
jgi:alginate O-acetyltransferase complex protein AlgI